MIFIQIAIILGMGGGWFAQAKEPTAAVGTEQKIAAPTSQPDTAVPDVAYEDLALLVKNARRAFKAAVQELPERGANFKPSELSKLRGIVHLTLRRNGAILAEAESGEMPILDASAAAGTLLGKTVLAKKLRVESGGDDLGLEFEWLGPWSVIDVPYYDQKNGSWTDALLHAFEPAAEGIGVEFKGKRGWTRPGQIVSLNYSPDLALKGAEAVIDLKQIQKMRFATEIKYYRFWAIHLWQSSAAALPARLLRGDTLVPQASVDAAAIDVAIARIGGYLRFRQNPNGGFAEEYVPTGDVYNEANSAPIQLKSLCGLAIYAAWGNDAAGKSGDQRGFESFSKYIKPRMLQLIGADGKTVEKEEGSLLDLPGHGRQLEMSARLLLFSLTGNDPAQEEARAKLIRGLLGTQTEEGYYLLPEQSAGEKEEAATQPAEKVAPDDLANACVMLALSAARDNASKDAIDKSLERAATYYLRRPTLTMRPTAVIVLARAFAQYYAASNDAHLSDYVFKVADGMVSLQVTAETCPYPELYGAINVRAVGDVGADTAVCLTALADSVNLAERIGDKDRAERYRKAVALATRFVLQLEVRSEGTFFMRMPRAALGGIRMAPWNSRIRADDCASAVEGLIRARSVLYGPRRAS